MTTRFLELVPAQRAYELIAGFEPLAVERLDPRQARGRVLAEDIEAPEDVPHFDRSNMDGYAVRAEDTCGASESSAVLLRLAGSVAMGTQATVAVTAGTAIQVSTGAMLPPGADAVVMVEDTEEEGADMIAVRRPVVAGENLIRRGEDVRRGEVIARRGKRLGGSDVGALVGLGVTEIAVHRSPRIGVIVTGDEIVEPGRPLGPGQVRNANEYLLTSMAAERGFEVCDYGVIADRRGAVVDALSRALAECDLVFVSGGSSKGPHDLTRSAIEAIDDSEILLHGIAIAPGKPTILARVGARAVMGLPGNPAAVAVVFTLFGSALARVLAGEPIDRVLLGRPRVPARLAESMPSTPGREDFVRVRLESTGDGVLAYPQRGKSVSLTTLSRADGLISIPRSSEGLEAGADVEVILFQR